VQGQHAADSGQVIGSLLFIYTVLLSGGIVGHIDEVALRRAGLVLRWVTVCGYTISVFNQAIQANSA